MSSAEIDRRVQSIDAEHAFSTTLPSVEGATVAEKYGHMIDQVKSSTPNVGWLLVDLTSWKCGLEFLNSLT